MLAPPAVVHEIWRHRIVLFWPAWIATTIVAASLTAWTVSRAMQPAASKDIGGAVAPARPRMREKALAGALVMLLVGLYVVLSLTWEDFAHYDHSTFTLLTLRGRSFTPPIWPNNGRFFPLGLQEFNLIAHFTHSIVGYHVPALLQLLLLCGVLLALLRISFSPLCSAALVGLLLLSPAILISYTGLVYPERNVIFWIACLLLCVARFDDRYSPAWAAVAVVCAQFLLYYKETAFALVGVFALARVALHCRDAEDLSGVRKHLADKAGRFNLCLAALGVLFLIHYLADMLPRPHLTYGAENRLPLGSVLQSYVKADLLAIVFLGFAAVRLCLILKRRVQPDMLWDALGFGGATCALAYLKLGLFSIYYFAPVDLAAVLYLGRLAVLKWKRFTPWAKFAVATFTAVILLQNLYLSSFEVFEEKNIVRSKMELADTIAAQHALNPSKSLRLFVPFADPYVLMEFAAYLDYRTLPIEGTDHNPGTPIVLISRLVTTESRCVPFRSVICHPGREPAPGDLVLELPDDEASVNQEASFTSHGRTLFATAPCPRLPQWLEILARRFHAASLRFANKQLPGHWLQASVTIAN